VTDVVGIEIGEISKFIGRYSLGRDNGFDSLHFLRIKIPAGQINSEKLRKIADLSRKYGRGYVEITDRQDIQLHWIKSEDALDLFERLYEIGYYTDMCGQGFSKACFGDVRNITACPLSGKINDFDVARYAKHLTSYFTGNKEFLDLPRKFKIGFTGCGGDCLRLAVNDLGMFGISREGERGFVPFVGGSVGASQPEPMLAKSLGIFVPEKKVFEFVKAVVEIHRDHSSRESKAKARFKNLVTRWGIEKLRKEIEEKTGVFDRIDFNRPVYSNHNSYGLQTDGLYYYTLPVVGGTLSSEKIEFIADMAEKHGSGQLRLTADQNITFVDIADVDRLKRDLERQFEIREGRIYFSSIACTSKFCGKTRSPHAKELLKKLIEICERKGMKNLRIHVSGCRNSCACHQVADIGLVGKAIKVDGEVVQAYDIYVGGNFAKLKMGRVYMENLHGERLFSEFERLLEVIGNGVKAEAEG